MSIYSYFTVIKTDMSQKVPFILGDLNDDQDFDLEDELEPKVNFFDCVKAVVGDSVPFGHQGSAV